MPWEIFHSFPMTLYIIPFCPNADTLPETWSSRGLLQRIFVVTSATMNWLLIQVNLCHICSTPCLTNWDLRRIWWAFFVSLKETLISTADLYVHVSSCHTCKASLMVLSFCTAHCNWDRHVTGMVNYSTLVEYDISSCWSWGVKVIIPTGVTEIKHFSWGDNVIHC